MLNLLFKEMLKDYLAPQLKNAGFKKKGQTWNRPVNDELVHVINVQKSGWSDSEEISFTVNMGLFVRPVYQIIWNREASKIIAESDCFPRFRIGRLPGKTAGKDIWWELHDRLELSSVGNEIAKKIEEDGLPLLDRCRSIPDVLSLANSLDKKRMIAQEKLSYGVLMYWAGQKDAGLVMLDELQTNSRMKGWESRICEIRGRLCKQ